MTVEPLTLILGPRVELDLHLSEDHAGTVTLSVRCAEDCCYENTYENHVDALADAQAVVARWMRGEYAREARWEIPAADPSSTSSTGSTGS